MDVRVHEIIVNTGLGRHNVMHLFGSINAITRSLVNRNTVSKQLNVGLTKHKARVHKITIITGLGRHSVNAFVQMYNAITKNL